MCALVLVIFAACIMSSAFPCGDPSKMSVSTTSASSRSTIRTASVDPTNPPPTTVTFFLLIFLSPFECGSELPLFKPLRQLKSTRSPTPRILRYLCGPSANPVLSLPLLLEQCGTVTPDCALGFLFSVLFGFSPLCPLRLCVKFLFALLLGFSSLCPLCSYLCELCVTVPLLFASWSLIAGRFLISDN